MALELCMLGLIVQDMDKSLRFYRQLGVDFPEDSENKTHIDVKMGNLTFFLDSRPTRWDSRYVRKESVEPAEAALVAGPERSALHQPPDQPAR